MYTRKLGSEALGSEALGSEALGSEALGSEALGSEALGSEALGSEALGSEAKTFCHWMRCYERYNNDQPHCLDFCRVLTKDYSVLLAGLKMNLEELDFEAKGKDAWELDGFAELNFFCTVACVEKVEQAKEASKGIALNSVDALRILKASYNFLDEHPEIRAYNSDRNHPQARGCAKLLVAVTIAEDTSLILEEVTSILKVCEHIPVHTLFSIRQGLSKE
jgi:hypothetical protein